eukprot:4729413-Prymnesium_polylepis.1
MEYLEVRYLQAGVGEWCGEIGSFSSSLSLDFSFVVDAVADAECAIDELFANGHAHQPNRHRP